MRKTKRQTGITLVALVVTIIILLILAGITISSLTNTGLFGRAKEAKEKTQNAEKNQQATLDSYEEQIGIASGAKEYTSAKTITEAQTEGMLSKKINSTITDEYGNKITVPAGFKITNDATTVDKGIVIIDSNENEFVWIPVGTIYTDTAKTESNAKTIELGRYFFDETTGAKSAYSGNYVEEDKGNTNTTLKNYGNTIAKNITNFKNSVATNGGYYIGRYEARTTTKRTAEGNALTQITEKGTDQIYNYVKQPQAAKLSQEMYNSNKFTSDLMNSYAWDTATLFLQTCGTNATYSRQNSLNTGSISQTGTNTQSIKDVQCNVYDMASNVREWTTETTENSTYSCSHRGGGYLYNSDRTGSRSGELTSRSSNDIGFRPILYLSI